MKFSFTRPLGLQRELKQETFKLHGIAWVSVGLALFGLFLLRGEWVLLPGIPLELPIIASEAQEGARIENVLTISASETLFFRGKVVALNQLKDVLARSKSGQNTTEATLLLKADRRISLNLLLEVGDIARSSGFQHVHLACQSFYPSAHVMEF